MPAIQSALEPPGPALEELVEHLSASTPMPSALAARLIEEVVAHLAETVEEYVRRRHRELQAAGWTNADIFGRLARELPQRRFRAPTTSERQLRRIVYG